MTFELCNSIVEPLALFKAIAEEIDAEDAHPIWLNAKFIGQWENQNENV